MSDPNTPAPGTTAGTSSASADDLAAQVEGPVTVPALLLYETALAALEPVLPKVQV